MMLKMKPRHYAIGAVLMAVTGALVFMRFDTTPPYEFDASQSEVIPPRTEPGTQIVVRWKVKKVNRFCHGMNTRELFDAETKARIAVYDPVPVASPFELSENEHLVRTFTLPKIMPYGRIGYRATQQYICNPLQHIWPLVVTTPDLFFEVRNANH